MTLHGEGKQRLFDRLNRSGKVLQRSGGRTLLKVKLAGRSALVEVASSSQQITARAGLVLVRELAVRSTSGSCSTR